MTPGWNRNPTRQQEAREYSTLAWAIWIISSAGRLQLPEAVTSGLLPPVPPSVFPLPVKLAWNWDEYSFTFDSSAVGSAPWIRASSVEMEFYNDWELI